MTKNEFWEIIALLRSDLVDSDEIDGENPVIASAVDALAREEPEDIKGFDDILAELVYDLDGESYAQFAGVCGEFEDLFLYCRCCVVASGPEAYDAILSDPSEMPNGMEFEPLLSIAELAWKKRTGQAYDHEPEISLEMRANSMNWPD